MYTRFVIWNEVYYELVYEEAVDSVDLLYSVEDVLHDKAHGFVRGVEMGFNLFLCRIPSLKRRELTKALRVAKEVLHHCCDSYSLFGGRGERTVNRSLYKSERHSILR